MEEDGAAAWSTPALQAKLRDGLRHLVMASSGDLEQAAPPALKSLLPTVFASGWPEQREKLDAAGRQVQQALPGVLRHLCFDIAEEAHAKGAAPMQWVARAGAEPALLRLLAFALLCQKHGALDSVSVLVMLEDIQEACVVDQCRDIIAWLEAQLPVLSSPQFCAGVGTQHQLTRLCNALLRRLGKHDAVSKARLLCLIASCTPLMDRSGVGVTGAFAPPDPPRIEDVPPGAVDSTGKPVDGVLYKTFWGLQALLQDPLAMATSLDKWSTFKRDLSLVLAELGKVPATVPAVRPSAPDAAAEAGGGGGVSAAAAAAEEASGTQCYLSSHRLFGLQFTDAAFRREFLVQVLITLHALLVLGKAPPNKPPDAVGFTKPKQRMEAVALQKEVYKVLEATPRSGREFCRAVQEVLERESSWVQWKRGGRSFVVPGVEAAQPAAAASAPAGGALAAGKPITSCIDWHKPPAPPLAAAVAAARSAAAKREAANAQRIEDGLALLREVETAGRTYDSEGAPQEKPAAKRARYASAVRMLGSATGAPDGGSSLTFWARTKHAEAEASAGKPAPSLLEGLRVAGQPQYPTPTAVCAQLLREMDPECGLEAEYKRVQEDALFRWRMGRAAAQALPEHMLDSAANIEAAMLWLLPELVPPAFKAKWEEEQAAAARAKAEQREARAKQSGPPGAGPASPKPAAKAGAGRPRQQPAAAAGGAAGAAAGGGSADGSAREQGSEQQQAATPKPDDAAEAADNGAAAGADADGAPSAADASAAAAVAVAAADAGAGTAAAGGPDAPVAAAAAADGGAEDGVAAMEEAAGDEAPAASEPAAGAAADAAPEGGGGGGDGMDVDGPPAEGGAAEEGEAGE